MSRTAAATRPGWWSFLGAVLGWCALLLLLAVLAVAVVVPRLLGGQAWSVLTGSMRPGYPPGSLVVTRPVDPEAIGLGSVITYQVASGRSAVVTHRVVAVGTSTRGERTFTTRGDANGADDREPVRAVQVRGEVVYGVPWLGHVNGWLAGDRRLVAVGAGAGLLVLYALVMFAGELRDGARRRAAEGAS
ncbi:signal peptidase I [Microlunatus capsulatus]|uniref:Signal peptidase I n=1 Tax=Microlunatus capsulatus TaxID=99117 RepID=A0ABS4ZBV6_9ACTN|nr:signal peptidase I [Microlunatus capsulatus]MBP2418541.1 signal peptidase [Microlunatus capsulatus]